MPRKRRKLSASDKRARSVFLNVPYDDAFDNTLVGLTVALIVLGRVPRLTLEVADGGQGRLKRIFDLLKSCAVSFHDLSFVNLPVRFNMPFELGLACAIREQNPDHHSFFILEAQPHRIQQHLSDVNGIDPKIHHNTAEGGLTTILETLERPGGNPSVAQVRPLLNVMLSLVPQFRADHGNRPFHSKAVYQSFVAGCFEQAAEMGLLLRN